MSKNKNRNYNIAILGLLVAVMIILWETPLGTIPLGGVTVTISHIPILIATLMLGLKEGLALGLVFGLISMIKAYLTPMTPLDPLFQNPFISVLPRLMIPIMTYLTAKLTSKLNKTLSATLSAAVGNLSNTFFVFLSMFLLVSDKLEAIGGKSALTLIIEIVSAIAFLETLAVVVITVPIVTRLKIRRK